MTLIQQGKNVLLTSIACLLASASLVAVVVKPTAVGVDFANRPELKEADRAGLFGKLAKDFNIQIFRPGENVIELITCGTEVGDGEVLRIESPSDLESLKEIRHQLFFIDGKLKMDEKYDGYRSKAEYVVAATVDSMLRGLGVIEDKKPRGTVLVDQYVEGMPMKLVFDSYESFAALRRYLEPKFEARNVLSAGKATPLLLLEFTKDRHVAAITADDMAFLNKYFTLCDPANEAVKSFFRNLQSDMYDARHFHGGKPRYVGESFTEEMWREFEGGFGDLKIGALAKMVGSAVLGALIVEGLKDFVKKHESVAKAKTHVKGFLTDPKCLLATGGSIAAVAALYYFVRRYYLEQEKEAHAALKRSHEHKSAKLDEMALQVAEEQAVA